MENTEPIKPIEETEEVSKPFMPFVVGIFFVLLAFYQPSIVTDSASALTVNLTINIIMRLIVVVWLLDLAKKFELKQTLWIILGLLFGGWTLIVVNLIIWYDQPMTITQDMADQIKAQAQANVEEKPETLQPLNLTECPACQAPLHGEEECTGCGLSLKA
ncbi:MAG TPA: hypothetical protein VGK39_00275 [Cyclobacteriaceae bacterium]